MKRPNEYSKPLGGVRTEGYHPADKDSQYAKDLDKYIDFLESEMKKYSSNTALSEACEQIINYIEEDAEIPIPIKRFFNEDGSHITKKEYGKVLLEILCVELREKFRIKLNKNGK